MNLRRYSVVVTLGLVLLACSNSSKSKTAASGTPASKTSAAPSGGGTPNVTVNVSVVGNSSYATSDSDVTCDSSEEGQGVCVDTYIVFCAGGAGYAFDCNTAYPGSTCDTGDDGQLDCFDE
jgi:hypothetical protein